MTKKAVTEALGFPDDEMVPSRRGHQIACWKYGDIEIYFAPPDCTVSCVFADDFDVLDGGTGLEIDSGRLHGGTNWNELVKALEGRDVPFSEVASPSPGDRWLRTASGVTLVVVTEPEEFGPTAGLRSLCWGTIGT